MDEFDSSKPNLLSTEFASAFACIYHFSSSSSCIMAKLLQLIPMAASTLASLYEADTISNNDLKSIKSPEKPSREPSIPYDFTSIFRRNNATPPPIPVEDGNTHSGLLASVIQSLSFDDSNSHSNVPVKENSSNHIKVEPDLSSKDKPPVKPIKVTSLVNSKTSKDTLEEVDDATSSVDATETKESSRPRRFSLTKQKAITDMSADMDDDLDDDFEANDDSAIISVKSNISERKL